MRRFKSTLSITVWGIVLGLGCFAGIGFAANFSDKSIGISIDLDDEFIEQTQWHGYTVFSTADSSASVMIKPVHDINMYDLRQSLKGVTKYGKAKGGSWRGDDINLNVTDTEKSASVSSGSGFLVPVKGRVSGFKVRGVLGVFSGYGDQGFVVIGVARPDYWNEWKERTRAMFESIHFIEIDYSEMITNWEQRLAGKSLAPQNPVARGPLVPQPINLCSNGTVVDEQPENTQQPTAAPTQQPVWNGTAWVTVPVAPMPRPPARWSIDPIRGKPTLVIRHGPRPQEFELEMEGDELYVNGKPYSITENTLCQ
jgi:hypothetical protein